MRKRAFTALILCLLTTGCWDKVELEDRGFVVSIGLDKFQAQSGRLTLTGAEQDNQYTVTAVMPNGMDIKENAVSDKTKSVKSADSATVSGALRLIDMGSSQKLYLKQAKMLLWSESLLQDEKLFQQALDAMERSQDISRKMFLIASKEPAWKVLSAPLGGEPMLGVFMENFYKNNGGGGSILFRQILQKTISDLRSSGCTVMPVLEIKDLDHPEKKDASTDKAPEDTEASRIMLTGCAVIRNYTLAGYLNAIETRGYEWIGGHCRDAEISLPRAEEQWPMRVIESGAKFFFSEEGGALRCDVEIHVTGDLDEHHFTGASVSLDRMQVYAAEFETAIAGEITRTADILQKQWGADAYHFKESLRKKNSNLFQRYGEDWESSYRSMKIIPRVRVELVSAGSVR
ncbi:MAG: Ger(x)C family spore germination protein [Clostridiales bacterium]|nr:Ger(x)C family spore germination protein [Clostridiales bacterium]